jgi:hypothetical protein
MRPLTIEDLLPLEEYVRRRSELFDALLRYQERYRRVPLGPQVLLLFENRQTLWFRVQEIVRIARLEEPRQVQEQLDWYNTLLPRRDRLQAALLLRLAEDHRLLDELAPWRAFQGPELQLHLGERICSASLLTCRPTDRCLGTAHWVQFVVDSSARRRLADFTLPAYFTLDLPHYQQQSSPLSEEVRQSLLDDLALSDRDPL